MPLLLEVFVILNCLEEVNVNWAHLMDEKTEGASNALLHRCQPFSASLQALDATQTTFNLNIC